MYSDDQNHIGGVLVAMLEPAGGFGKFVAVLLALSVVGNIVCVLASCGDLANSVSGCDVLRNHAQLPSPDSTARPPAAMGFCHCCNRGHYPSCDRSSSALLYSADELPRT